MATAQPKAQPVVFRISQTFNVPRERMWKAWTTTEQAKWFGPKGSKIIYNTVDLRPGGASRYGMEFNGNKTWGKWAYKDIKAPEKIVAIVAFTDEGGEKIIPHPGMPGWPREMLSTVRFNVKGDKTEILVEWEPYNPTPEERRVFDENQASMQGGWSGTFEQLEAYFATNT